MSAYSYSSFLITVNSQSVLNEERYPEEYKRVTKAFQDGLNHFMDNLTAFIVFKVEGEGEEKIKNITYSKGAYEWGESDNKYHIHYGIQIKHKTKIQLNNKKIAAFWSDVLFDGKKKVHLDVGFKRHGEDYDIAVRYIGKSTKQKSIPLKYQRTRSKK